MPSLTTKLIHNIPDEDKFLNRELSWLEFNRRVLGEALHKDTKLLEKLKFLSIFSKNQDEFFMVRVAGLKQMLKKGFVHCETPDHRPIRNVLDAINQGVSEMQSLQYKCLHRDLLPKLEKEGIKIFAYSELSKVMQASLTEYFLDEIFPILTPLAVDPSHPYPFLSNLSIYLVLEFKPCKSMVDIKTPLGFVEIPSIIPRMVRLKTKAEQHHFILLEDLIQAHTSHLFLGFEVETYSTIRVTRNLDYQLLESNVVNLLETLEKEVLNKVQQDVVRIEISGELQESTLEVMKDNLRLTDEDICYTPSPMDISGLSSLYELPFDHLREGKFNPRLPARMSGNKNIFTLIREKDLLLHHPFESFYAVIELLNAAANDPQVYAIKQTLYRSSGDSPVIASLIRAAENGKHVTAVIELKARFDEKNNIVWSRMLERAGVNVVYGFVGLKTHCKTTLIIRKEADGMKRYAHLSTGNYNSQTAKQYTDLGLFTCCDALCKDISTLFNLLTGFNILSESSLRLKAKEVIPTFNRMVIAPLHLRQKIVQEIDQVIASHKKNGEGLIMAKLNGLVDRIIIEKLYEASCVGVSIKLLVRGICCLRPKIKGLSENIDVISLVDCFLEHSRIYYFRYGQKDHIYLGSADWMTRNMDRRIEIMYPIDDKDLQNRIIFEILATYWNDNTKSMRLYADGSYKAVKRAAKKEVMRAQFHFIALAREEGIKSVPYEKAIRYDLKKKGRPIAYKKPVRKS